MPRRNARTVSLFSGCGGMDLGFLQAGFGIVWANDRNKWAYETYKRNISDHVVLGDIRGIDVTSLPDCDLVVGGPPCQAFSQIGKLMSDDERADHIWTFAKTVAAKRPRFFVMENVKNLATSARFRQLWLDIQDFYRDIGYRAEYRILTASAFDVAQDRERVFLIGTTARKVDPLDLFPTERTYVLTARDAIGDLPSAGEPGNEGVVKSKIVMVKRATQAWNPEDGEPILRRDPYGGNLIYNGKGRPINLEEPAQTLVASTGGNHTPIVEQNLLDDPDGKSWHVAYWKSLWEGKRYPFGTPVPKQLRRITIREAARIQGFPDWFEFLGPNNQQWLMIGNAVPPPMARHIARMIMGVLQGKPVYEPIPVGPASRTVAGRLAIGEIVTERDSGDPDMKHVWIDGDYMGMVLEEDGRFYAHLRGAAAEAERRSEYEAFRALPMLELAQAFGELRELRANPDRTPAAAISGLGFHGKGPEWYVGGDGRLVSIEASDGRGRLSWGEPVLVTYVDAGEFVEDFEAPLDVVVAALQRWLDDEAPVEEVMTYVAVAAEVLPRANVSNVEPWTRGGNKRRDESALKQALRDAGLTAADLEEEWV